LYLVSAQIKEKIVVFKILNEANICLKKIYYSLHLAFCLSGEMKSQKQKKELQTYFFFNLK